MPGCATQSGGVIKGVYRWVCRSVRQRHTAKLNPTSDSFALCVLSFTYECFPIISFAQFHVFERELLLDRIHLVYFLYPSKFDFRTSVMET